MSSKIGSIHLVRHGKPDLSRKVKLKRQGYNTWWQEYGRVSLVSDQQVPDTAHTIADACAVILSSSIPRAAETGVILARTREVIVDDVFVEAPLPAPWIPFLSMRPLSWGTISRIVWLLGYADGGETRRDSQARAARAADILIEHAGNGGDVLLCAHGWFNRMIGRALRLRGWDKTNGKGGDKYWGFRTYNPPV